MARPLIQVCCISAGRPGNVPTVMKQFPHVAFYVPERERGDYVAAGAAAVMVYGVEGKLPMKARQANQALEDYMATGGFDVVATVDDDIVRVLDANTRQEVNPMLAVNAIALALWEHPTARLAGPYSGTNTSWAGGAVKYTGNVPGAMQLHKRVANKPYLAYDAELLQLEDLDLCVQHHLNNHGVLLHGGYCLENLWADNPGGYQSVRTLEHLAKNVDQLQAKWGEYGCKFLLDENHRNGMRFRIPWRQLADWYRDEDSLV